MKKGIKNDWLQKGIENRKKMEQQQEDVAKNKEILDKSDLLARIEHKKQGIEIQTLYHFELKPLVRDYLSHVKEVGCEVRYGDRAFSIEAMEDGIYLRFDLGLRRIQVEGKLATGLKLNPHKVSDEEIHDWFGQIVSK